MKSDRPASITSWRRSGESRSKLLVTPQIGAISRVCSLSESASGLFRQQQTLPGGGVCIGAGAEASTSVFRQQQSLFAGSAPTHSCRTCSAAPPGRKPCCDRGAKNQDSPNNTHN